MKRAFFTENITWKQILLAFKKEMCNFVIRLDIISLILNLSKNKYGTCRFDIRFNKKIMNSIDKKYSLFVWNTTYNDIVVEYKGSRSYDCRGAVKAAFCIGR